MTKLVEASDSVLVVVDLQEGWFSERLSEEMRSRLFERASWITAAARELEIPVLVTEEDAARNGATAAAVTDHLDDDAVAFDKETFDASSDTAILSALEASGRRTAVLIGMETDVCIAQSAVGLSGRGFRVLVAADAVAAPEEEHREGLERMRALEIELIGTKALFYEWTRTVKIARELRRRLAALDVDSDRL